MINKNFEMMLRGLNNPNKIKAVNFIMAKFKEALATDSKLYQNKQKIQKCIDELFSTINTTDKFLEALIKIEASGPYSIFAYILNEDFSDIMFHWGGYQVSNNAYVDKVFIDKELLPIYYIFLDHFIENIMFISSSKFDKANAILDGEVGIYRFNLVHSSLNVREKPSIVIRKNTMGTSFNMDESYIDGVVSSERQKETIQKYALEGNVIVFGSTGSGKTTLLKYMGNYRLPEKRNIITIEDTAELNMPIPLALITNNHYKIKDLFKASLRQFPSHMIVGETRTDEIVDILESSLTISCLTTIHANSFERAIQRIVFMSMPRKIPSDTIKDLINASIDCFIFMEARKVKGMWEKKDDKHYEDIYEAYEEVK